MSRSLPTQTSLSTTTANIVQSTTGIVIGNGVTVNSIPFTVIKSLTSSVSTHTPSVSSSSSSRSLPLVPIIGGLLAAFAVLLFIFLLLKCRSSQRKIRRLQAEMDSPTFMEDDTSFGFGIDKERLGGSYVSLDDGPKSALSPPITSPPNALIHPNRFH